MKLSDNRLPTGFVIHIVASPQNDIITGQVFTQPYMDLDQLGLLFFFFFLVAKFSLKTQKYWKKIGIFCRQIFGKYSDLISTIFRFWSKIADFFFFFLFLAKKINIWVGCTPKTGLFSSPLKGH